MDTKYVITTNVDGSITICSVRFVGADLEIRSSDTFDSWAAVTASRYSHVLVGSGCIRIPLPLRRGSVEWEEAVRNITGTRHHVAFVPETRLPDFSQLSLSEPAPHHVSSAQEYSPPRRIPDAAIRQPPNVKLARRVEKRALRRCDPMVMG